jgi:hypothetical protein
MGFELAFAFTFVTYSPFRYFERKRFPSMKAADGSGTKW